MDTPLWIIGSPLMKKNEKGQVVFFLVFIIPLIVLALVMTAEFSRLVSTKIKLQGTLDRSVFAGAAYLAHVLNQTALSNRKVHEEFLKLQERFREGSKTNNRKEAKDEIKKTWGRQNQIFDEEIVPKVEEAYEKAYQIARQIVEKDFPNAKLSPLYFSPIALGEGRMEFLPFGEIKGITFDPRGYQKVPKTDLEVRLAFIKNFDPSFKTAFAAGVALKSPPSLIPLLKLNEPLRAVAAAQPYGGSIWGYALTKKKEDLYHTAMVPLKTLPIEGYQKVWEDFNPYDVAH